MMIEVKNICCVRNEQILFRNVAFHVLPGQMLEIVGKNGCGKTTLLRTIAGLLPPHSGTIKLNTQTLCYVGHQAGLHPDLSVQQNLAFLSTLLGSTACAEHALEYFAMAHKRDAKCGELSAGQLQRVNLARLCLAKAQLWILDEPLAHLDAATHELLRALCVQHLAQGGAIITATHNRFQVCTQQQVFNLEEY